MVSSTSGAHVPSLVEMVSGSSGLAGLCGFGITTTSFLFTLVVGLRFISIRTALYPMKHAGAPLVSNVVAATLGLAAAITGSAIPALRSGTAFLAEYAVMACFMACASGYVVATQWVTRQSFSSSLSRRVRAARSLLAATVVVALIALGSISIAQHAQSTAYPVAITSVACVWLACLLAFLATFHLEVGCSVHLQCLEESGDVEEGGEEAGKPLSPSDAYRHDYGSVGKAMGVLMTPVSARSTIQ